MHQMEKKKMKMDIGLYFWTSCPRRLLKRGLTLAIFILSWKIPVIKEALMMCSNGCFFWEIGTGPESARNEEMRTPQKYLGEDCRKGRPWRWKDLEWNKEAGTIEDDGNILLLPCAVLQRATVMDDAVSQLRTRYVMHSYENSK